MKLLILFTVVACLHVSGKGFSQTITLSLENAPLEKVFKEIKKQTGYAFVYTRAQLKNTVPVTYQVRNGQLKDVLENCFRNQPLSFVIEGRYIVVQTKAAVTQSTTSILLPIDISGKVINEDGEALAGVTIAAKKSGKATSTNERGEFSLKGVNDDDLLIVTSVGYYKEELPVDKQYSFLIRLKIAVGSLDETIVKGYYSTSKRLNTGSVGKVTSADITCQPVSNPLAALQAQVPGLIITQANGLPGSNFTVRIRGQNSIQNGNSPLYVIDGVPFLNDEDVLTQRSGINANSPFNTINPADIESIEILKDADATAIYGSRGANGVIVITTKKGKIGKTSLDVNMYYGWGKTTRSVKYMNTSQYLQMRREAFLNDGITPDPSNAYDLLVWDTTRYTNLEKLLIGNTAHTSNVTMQLSGGSESTKFTLGSNYFRETTVFPGNNDFKRITLSLGLTHRSSNNKFYSVFSASYASDNSNLLRQDLTQYINQPPNIPELYDSAGRLNWSKNGFSFNNPLANTLRDYKVTTDRLTANLLAEYKIFDPLKVKINLGYNSVSADEKDQVPISSQDPAFNPTGSAFFGRSTIKTWIIEPQVEFNKVLSGGSKFQFQIGITAQQNQGKINAINASGYTNDNLLSSTVGAHSLNTQVSSQLYRYNAVFGHIGYALQEKYLLNLTGRRDGSSRFGPGKQFANFWAIGAGWIFSNEKFIETKVPFLSYGKIRGSYGIAGNDLIGNYKYLDLYGSTYYPYQGQPSLFPVGLFNSDYSWEQIKKLDIAVELGFLKDRILFVVDWYKNKSDNQIINYSLPGQTGFNTVLKNFPGIVQNAGFEISLTSLNVKGKNFRWETSVNLTTQKNKLLEFPGLNESSYAQRYIIGKSLNSRIGSIFLGVDEQSGVYQFLDKDKNPVFSPSTSDYTYLGNTDPKLYGGIKNKLSYLRWQLDILFELKKQSGINPFFNSFAIVGNASNQPVFVLDRWQKPGDQAQYQRFTQTFSPAGIATFYLYNSSAVLTDASFIRLKNLSLSYTIPSNMTHKAKIEGVRLYIEGQNLFLITKYKGPDPENQSYYALPPLKKFVMGVRISF